MKEDENLKQLIKNFGSKDWQLIASHTSGRNGKQCRERWVNHIRPGIKKAPWNEREHLILKDAREIYGNNWALISKYISGRTCNDLKTHSKSMR